MGQFSIVLLEIGNTRCEMIAATVVLFAYAGRGDPALQVIVGLLLSAIFCSVLFSCYSFIAIISEQFVLTPVSFWRVPQHIE